MALPKNAFKATPRRQDDVLSRKNADGTVSVMRLDNDKYFFTIDGIAAEAWGLIDGIVSIEKIKNKLLEKHRPPLDIFDRDLTNFFSRLKKEKLINL